MRSIASAFQTDVQDASSGSPDRVHLCRPVDLIWSNDTSAPPSRTNGNSIRKDLNMATWLYIYTILLMKPQHEKYYAIYNNMCMAWLWFTLYNKANSRLQASTASHSPLRFGLSMQYQSVACLNLLGSTVFFFRLKKTQKNKYNIAA